MKTNKLIQICWEVQRFSPNNDIGKITDEELITIYLFSMLDEKLKIKSKHEHITNYWKSWFPNYQNFNSRMNRLAPAFQLMVPFLMEKFSISADTTKKLHYFSVKLHCLNLRNKSKLPLPKVM